MGQDAQLDDLTLHALQEAIENHIQRGNSGRFVTVAIPGYGYSIVPDQARNRAGNLVSVSSPLNVQIAMKPGKIRTSIAIRELCEAVSNVSGFRIDTSVGLYHSGLFDDTMVTVDGKPEVARTALARLLRNIETSGPLRKTSWQLMYDPTHSSYMLHVTVVEQLRSSQLGGNGERVPLNWPLPVSGSK
jgi:hypothetical protein